MATDLLGTIQPGRIADLGLLDASPLEDIRNTRRIRIVVSDGHVFDREAITALEALTPGARFEVIPGAAITCSGITCPLRWLRCDSPSTMWFATLTVADHRSYI